jgi:hypothetical protein
MRLNHVVLLCCLAAQGCSNPTTSATQNKKAQEPSRASSDSKPSASGGSTTETKTPVKTTTTTTADSVETVLPPQPVTGILLSCANPGIEDRSLNIDCMLKDEAGLRVEPATLGSRVAYTHEAMAKDDKVLVSVNEAGPNKPYDVRYSVRAKDVTKIERVIASTIFFAKVYDSEGKEIKNRVKPFLGFNLKLPSKSEILKKWNEITHSLPF